MSEMGGSNAGGMKHEGLHRSIRRHGGRSHRTGTTAHLGKSRFPEEGEDGDDDDNEEEESNPIEKIAAVSSFAFCVYCRIPRRPAGGNCSP